MTVGFHKGPPHAPPVIEKRAEAKIVHGVALNDDYAWLRAPNWREVLRDPDALPRDIRAVIEAENDYARAVLTPEEAARKALVTEMRARIKEDDAEVPLPDGAWNYYSRHEEGGQHPIFCRARRDGGAEEIFSTATRRAAARGFSILARRSIRQITPSSPGAPTKKDRSFIRSASAILAPARTPR